MRRRMLAVPLPSFLVPSGAGGCEEGCIPGRCQTSAYVSIRQPTSVVSIPGRCQMSAYVSIRQVYVYLGVVKRQHTSAYVSIREPTSANVRCIPGRCQTSAYVSIRQIYTWALSNVISTSNRKPSADTYSLAASFVSMSLRQHAYRGGRIISK